MRLSAALGLVRSDTPYIAVTSERGLNLFMTTLNVPWLLLFFFLKFLPVRLP
jgi:hypothetical protein